VSHFCTVHVNAMQQSQCSAHTQAAKSQVVITRCSDPRSCYTLAQRLQDLAAQY